jgi:hypothetical protein
VLLEVEVGHFMGMIWKFSVQGDIDVYSYNSPEYGRSEANLRMGVSGTYRTIRDLGEY